MVFASGLKALDIVIILNSSMINAEKHVAAMVSTN